MRDEATFTELIAAMRSSAEFSRLAVDLSPETSEIMWRAALALSTEHMTPHVALCPPHLLGAWLAEHPDQLGHLVRPLAAIWRDDKWFSALLRSAGPALAWPLLSEARAMDAATPAAYEVLFELQPDPLAYDGPTLVQIGKRTDGRVVRCEANAEWQALLTLLDDSVSQLPASLLALHTGPRIPALERLVNTVAAAPRLKWSALRELASNAAKAWQAPGGQWSLHHCGGLRPAGSVLAAMQTGSHVFPWFWEELQNCPAPYVAELLDCIVDALPGRVSGVPQRGYRLGLASLYVAILDEVPIEIMRGYVRDRADSSEHTRLLRTRAVSDLELALNAPMDSALWRMLGRDAIDEVYRWLQAQLGDMTEVLALIDAGGGARRAGDAGGSLDGSCRELAAMIRTIRAQ